MELILLGLRVVEFLYAVLSVLLLNAVLLVLLREEFLLLLKDLEVYDALADAQHCQSFDIVELHLSGFIFDIPQP